MRTRAIAARIMLELSALIDALHSDIRYHQNMRWVMIRTYPLPAGFNYDHTSVIIFLPGLYPLLPPTGFAIRVSNDLTKDGAPLRTLAKDGWLYFPMSYEQQPWRVSEHNLLTVCNRIYEILDRFEP